jgi:hypothetical protein
MGVMEMTFPHESLRQHSGNHRTRHRAILSAADARQAESQTVRAVRRAERVGRTQGDGDIERIHYFAHLECPKPAVRGAFWKNIAQPAKCELSVYQADLMNIKQHDLEHEATGEQLTVRGMEHRGSHD